MDRVEPQKPVLILLYGFPGSGKTYFSRQFSEDVHTVHLEEDKVRYELFGKPRYSKQENFALSKVMEYTIGEFLNAGMSVIYDTNAMRLIQRKSLREVAKKFKAEIVVVWFQVDADTAYLRNYKRDRRHLDDRFAAGYDANQFKELASHMQQPEINENLVVISGKHTYPSQRSGVIKKLADMGVVKRTEAMYKMIKPELVNLVPNNSRDNGKNNHRSIIFD